MGECDSRRGSAGRCPDNSMVAMERWDAAHYAEQDAHTKVTAARDAYKDGLRAVNYGI